MKWELRAVSLQERDRLAWEEVVVRSGVIVGRLLELPEFERAKSVSCYVSKGNEVSTHILIKLMLRQQKEVFVPSVEGDALRLRRLTDWEQLAPGAFGVLEVVGGEQDAVGMEGIDLAILPGVAFDEQRNRLGYGCGFFDKLLRDSRAVKVGCAFESQIRPGVPAELHDVRMDLIVTEQRVIR